MLNEGYFHGLKDYLVSAEGVKFSQIFISRFSIIFLTFLSSISLAFFVESVISSVDSLSISLFNFIFLPTHSSHPNIVSLLPGWAVYKYISGGRKFKLKLLIC